MADVAVSGVDNTAEQAAVPVDSNVDSSDNGVVRPMLYADRAKQPPSRIDCNTQEVSSYFVLATHVSYDVKFGLQLTMPAGYSFHV